LSDAIPEIPVVHEAQVTAAHVYTLVSDQVIPRLIAVEEKSDKSYQILKSAGILNGKGDELIQLVQDWRTDQARENAWSVVRADLKHRVRFLQPGKHWLTVLLSAILGGIGWQVAGGHFSFPHLPHF
jgi:hypothetical protein